jgi:chaperone BCS1
MSLPLPQDPTRLLKSGYPQILSLVQNTVGLDPITLVNIGLAVVGLLTSLRYFFNHVYVPWTTVRIDDDDPLYQYVMRWMADHQFMNHQFRSVKAVSTSKSSWEDEEEALKSMIGVERLTEPDPNNLISYRSIVGRTPISLQPFQGTHIFRRHGSWILFQHRINSGSHLVPLPKEKGHVQLKCLGSSPAPLQYLMEEAQLHNLERTKSTTTILRAIANVRDMVRWTRFSARPSRDISTVIFDKGRKAALLKDINEYLHPHTRRWYANHGIPYRRGYLFSGAPGTGKTSLTSALAGIFGLDIYVLSLLDPNLNESQLMRLMSEVPARCIVLLEDVDAAGLSRPGNGQSKPRNQRKAINGPAQPEATDLANLVDTTTNRGISSLNDNNTAAPGVSVSLSGLLNAIDGVSSQEGRILIMTTNSPELLDRALVRPGRVDMHIVFELPSQEEMRELFLSMYDDGVVGPLQKAAPPIEHNGTAIKQGKGRIVIQSVNGTTDEDTDLEVLAGEFASSIPEKKFSLAALQGYLLQYKRKPAAACENAASWARQTMQKLAEEEEQREGRD